MTHTALARKYRPTRFGELVAQGHVAAGLRGAVGKGRVAHAYLLTGPRGVGKTTAARILAMALNCERRAEAGGTDGEPCGTCESCRRIWSGAANLDVVEIDAASNRGVDDARDLRERAMYAASAPGRFKVYIIDEAHMLTREAWNALLKILEEPPPSVVFVFATTEPQKIANTAAPVLSRVQRFDFRRIGPQAVSDRLRQVATAEGVTVEDDALVLIGRVAAGGMRDGLSLLDQALTFGEGPVTAGRVREALGLIDDELYAELLDAVAARRAEWVFPYVARLVEAGADLAEFVNGLGETLRAMMICKLGGEAHGVTETLRQTIDRAHDRFASGDVLRMLHLLQETETAIRRSPNARLYVETLLLRYVLLDRTVALEDVLDALGHPSGPAPAPPAPAPGPGARSGRSGGGTLLRDGGGRAAPTPAPAGPAPAPGAPPPAADALPGLDELRAAWPQVVASLEQRRPMVAAALTHAVPAQSAGRELTLEVTEGDVHLEGLERNRGEIESAVRSVFGAPARVTFRAGARARAGGASGPAGSGGQRLDQQTDRAQRLKAYRAKDQALDAVADALDLELLD
ncbi:MAG: DNA polymerase III subunit gamma/tau [Gemmatimonadota bacterium]|nr:DNA polymerase III subunit gamma/tau [Gemmatimonadota bacterium]